MSRSNATTNSNKPLTIGTGLVATAARVALGGFWLHEGYIKYHAGFGKADILIVTGSTAENPRVAGFYKDFTADVLGNAASFFGFMIPLIEVSLGVALILGVFTFPAALMSSFQLANYWFADQLVTQFPVMAMLAVVVVAFGLHASRYSLTSLALTRVPRPVPGRLRAWL